MAKSLWTGRLAYADPAWTPDLGPAHVLRTPEQLAPSAAELAGLVAAVHHACDTLSQLAAADLSQLTIASRAGRLLVPTRTLPESFDVPHPFAPAPGPRADPLLAAYRDARTASIQATSDTATGAAAVRAPSRIHITARTATQATSGRPAAAERDPADSAALRDPGMNPPGPVERILHGLGVTRPDALQQATIDRAAEHLILETAHQPHRRRSSFPANDVSTSASTAAIINHLLASGDPRAAAILHPPAPRKSAQPEIEP